MSDHRVERAAIIIQMADGTRMLYDFDPTELITVSTEPVYEIDTWQPMTQMRQVPQTLDAHGTLLGGTIWTGDMPTTEAPEKIEQPQAAIEPPAVCM